MVEEVVEALQQLQLLLQLQLHPRPPLLPTTSGQTRTTWSTRPLARIQTLSQVRFYTLLLSNFLVNIASKPNPEFSVHIY